MIMLAIMMDVLLSMGSIVTGLMSGASGFLRGSRELGSRE